MRSSPRRPLRGVVGKVHLLPERLAAPPARPWIRIAGSMTRAVASACGNAPTVVPCYEGPDRLQPFEARALGVSQRRRAYAREIALCVGSLNLVLARTVTLMQDPALPMLRGLNRTPLAEVLFVDPAWRRPGPGLALEQRPTPCEPALTGRMCLWRRRRGGSLLVQEYFLPALLQYTPAREIS